MGVFGTKSFRKPESLSQRFHWSKDFVEHLRTVHFALVLVATILIAAGTNTDSTRINTALIQLQQIAKFEREWPTESTRLYQQAMIDANLPTYWDEPVRIVLPARIYKGREISASFVAPENVITSAQGWRFPEGHFPSNLSTLSDFRDYWNALHDGMSVVLPRPPTAHSHCQETVEVEDLALPGHLIFDISRGNSRCAVVDYLFVRSNAPQLDFTFYFTVPEVVTPTSVLTLTASSTLPLPQSANAKTQKPLFSKTMIQIETKFAKIDETYLKRLFFNDWHSGRFETAFADLSSVSSRLLTMGIDDAVHRLESEAAATERTVSFLGFTVPFPRLSQWGLLILLALQLYFWLHLHELTNRIESDAEGWNVAWIGVYRTRMAVVFAAISCLILPILAAITLAFRLNSIGFYHRRTVLVSSCGVVLLSAIIGFLTLWRLVKLRENLPANAEPPQPEQTILS